MLVFILEMLFESLAGLPDAPAPKPSGIYQNSIGTMIIEALPEKTVVRLAAHLAPFTVTVKGNKVLANTTAGEICFKYNHRTNSFSGPDKVQLTKR